MVFFATLSRKMKYKSQTYRLDKMSKKQQTSSRVIVMSSDWNAITALLISPSVTCSWRLTISFSLSLNSSSMTWSTMNVKREEKTTDSHINTQISISSQNKKFVVVVFYCHIKYTWHARCTLSYRLYFLEFFSVHTHIVAVFQNF